MLTEWMSKCMCKAPTEPKQIYFLPGAISDLESSSLSITETESVIFMNTNLCLWIQVTLVDVLFFIFCYYYFQTLNVCKWVALGCWVWRQRERSLFSLMAGPEKLDTALQLCFTSPWGMLGIEALKWRYSSNFKELKQQNGRWDKEISLQKFSWLLSEEYTVLDGFSC